MSDHIIEQEQVEKIKSFFKNYSKAIGLGILLTIVIFVSWHYYEEHQNRIQKEASMLYEKLLREVDEDNSNAITRDANILIKKYKKTPYAGQASLILAKQAVYNGDYTQAIESLEWVIENSKIPALRQAARLRLARVLYSKQRYDEALKTLETIEDPAYKMAIYEIKGDILVAQGHHHLAQISYRAALEELAKADFSYPLLQMKYDDISGRDSVLNLKKNS